LQDQTNPTPRNSCSPPSFDLFHEPGARSSSLPRPKTAQRHEPHTRTRQKDFYYLLVNEEPRDPSNSTNPKAGDRTATRDSTAFTPSSQLEGNVFCSHQTVNDAASDTPSISNRDPAKDVNPIEICTTPAARSRKLTALLMRSVSVLELSEENPNCRPTPATEKPSARRPRRPESQRS